MRTRQAADVSTLKEFRPDKTPSFVTNEQGRLRLSKPMEASDPVQLALQYSYATALEKALQHSEVSSQPTTAIQINLRPTSPLVFSNWAKYPGNVSGTILLECAQKIKQLFHIGKHGKKKCISAEGVHVIIKESLLLDKWDVQVNYTVPKIRAFFSLNTRKIKQVIVNLEVGPDET